MANGCPFHQAPSSEGGRTHRYTPSQVEELRRDMEALAPAIAWVNEFVKQPHPELGRPGVVCPFVPEAVRQDLLQYFVLDVGSPNGKSQDATEEDYATVMEPAMLALRDKFVAGRITDFKTRLLHAYLIVFRGLDLELSRASELIESMQRRLKPRFVELGLMVGEFHPYSHAVGLRNPDFRPLRSPVPLLSFRNMVEVDLVFLSRKTDPAPLRVHFLKSYLNYLGPELSAGARIKAEIALQEAEVEMQQAEFAEQPPLWPSMELSPRF